MSEFKVLTKDEVALVFESVELINKDLKQLSVLEIVQKFKTVGLLVILKDLILSVLKLTSQCVRNQINGFTMKLVSSDFFRVADNG